MYHDVSEILEIQVWDKDPGRDEFMGRYGSVLDLNGRKVFLSFELAMSVAAEDRKGFIKHGGYPVVSTDYHNFFLEQMFKATLERHFESSIGLNFPVVTDHICILIITKKAIKDVILIFSLCSSLIPFPAWAVSSSVLE